MDKLEVLKKPLAILMNMIFILQIALFFVLISPQVSEATVPSSYIIINEIMQDPSAVADLDGEWFEIYNNSSSSIDISSWTIRDNGSDSHKIDTGGIPLTIAPSGYLVLGRNEDIYLNGGVTVDYKYDGFNLSNSSDEVIIEDKNGLEIDRVEYDGGPNFPDPTGASMVLINPSLDNNIGANWRVSTTPFGAGDLGTPGIENYYLLSKPDPSKMILTQNNPGTADTLEGQVGAIDGNTEVEVYKDSALTLEIGSTTASSDGSFGPFSIGDNQADENNLVYIVATNDYGYQSEATIMVNDITPPTLEVSILPDPAGEGDVEIRVVSSEELSSAIVLGPDSSVALSVKVTQKNQLISMLVPMGSKQGVLNTYIGKYKVVSGYDGEAEVEAQGADLAGNLSDIFIKNFVVDTVAPIAPGWIIAIPYDGIVNLSWGNSNDNSGVGIGGYKVYYGLQSNPTFNVLDVGNVTTFDIHNLTNSIPYYFYITAYDKAWNESEPSRQISMVPTTPTPPISNISLASAVYTAPSEEIISEAPEEIKGEEVAIGEGEKKEASKEEEIALEKKLPTWIVILLLMLLFIGIYLYSGQKDYLWKWITKVRSRK